MVPRAAPEVDMAFVHDLRLIAWKRHLWKQIQMDDEDGQGAGKLDKLGCKPPPITPEECNARVFMCDLPPLFRGMISPLKGMGFRGVRVVIEKATHAFQK